MREVILRGQYWRFCAMGAKKIAMNGGKSVIFGGVLAENLVV